MFVSFFRRWDSLFTYPLVVPAISFDDRDTQHIFLSEPYHGVRLGEDNVGIGIDILLDQGVLAVGRYCPPYIVVVSK